MASHDTVAVGQNANGETAAQAGPPADQAIGSGDYEVQQGECLASISARTGHFWQTIWQHPGNEELRRVRKNAMVLLPGDRLVIPQKRQRFESGPTDQRHKFIRKGVPAKLRLQFAEDGKPLANRRYQLTVDGRVLEGTTDAQGNIDVFIPPLARTASLRLGEGETEQAYELDLGQLDPVETVSGAQARLASLGFPAGPVDGRMGENTIDALRRFQLANNLTETGELDAPTQAKLKELHGS